MTFYRDAKKFEQNLASPKGHFCTLSCSLQKDVRLQPVVKTLQRHPGMEKIFDKVVNILETEKIVKKQNKYDLQ